MASVSGSEARATVAEAVEVRRARPALTIPIGLSRDETTSGFTLSLLGQFGSGIGDAAGLIKGWSKVPHDIRASRHYARDARVTRRLVKAAKRSEPGAGDVNRVSAFRQAIVEGAVHAAALGVCMLFRELAGDDALADEIVERRSPAWSAWCYRLAVHAEMNGDVELAREYLEQAFATAHPVWGTAAAMGLLDRLDATRDSEHVACLTEWIERFGDSAVVIELLFYGT